ncbi:MAG: cell division protein ZapD [Gammaproteobacteria bacterium]|nr:cell division protein ZapD [Gammaproteobacteria bacterium]
MNQIVTYEQPLNERLRTFLRIEQLMENFEHCLERDTAWDTHGALMLLLEILNLGARVDLKSDLMMELKRQIANMERLEQAPMVDSSRLHGIVERHQQLIASLHAQSGQPGAALKNNEFLNSIRQRTIIPGGTCDFDLPAYHYWLSEPVAARHDLLRTWIAPFTNIHAAVVNILSLVRESASPQRTRAAAGFYQQNLDVNQPYQLIRILLSEKSGYYPEISAGKHRFTVRFLRQPTPDTRGVPVDKDLEFALACCAL